jgi:hypothetical protein
MVAHQVKGNGALALGRDLHDRLLVAAIFQQCIDLDDIGAQSHKFKLRMSI